MARIRTVKPDFCTSKDTGALTRDARLFFLQLLTECDDEGRVLWLPKRLCGALYPHDDDVKPAMLVDWADECIGRRMVTIYDTPQGEVLAVINWGKHQRISHPTASKLPPPPEFPQTAPEEIRKAPESLRPEMEREVEREQGMSGKPDRAQFAEFWKAYPRKEAKDRAEAWWKTHKPDSATLAAMLAAIEWQRRDGCLKFATADGRSLIPLPASWLNAGRWKDERPSGPPAPTPPPMRHKCAKCAEPCHGRDWKGNLYCDVHWRELYAADGDAKRAALLASGAAARKVAA